MRRLILALLFLFVSVPLFAAVSGRGGECKPRGLQAGAFRGGDALAFLRRAGRTRLVLLDLTLPDMSGLELVKALKAEPALAEIPVLLVSGMPLVPVGGLPMLQKPVGPEDLLAAVRYHALSA